MQSIGSNGSMGRPTGWGRRPHLIQYLLYMIGEAAEEYYSKIRFPENESSMVRRWLHDLKPVNYLENLGHIDNCACFPRTQSQRTYVEGETLTIPPTQLMHAVVSCFTNFADKRSLRAPCHTQPRAEATRGCLQMDPRLKQSCWFRPI